MTKLPYPPTGTAQRDEEGEGPGVFAEFDRLVGDVRAITKQQAELRVQEVLRHVRG